MWGLDAPSYVLSRKCGLLDQEELLQHVADWRSNGMRIAFTNGCFDLLHVGHIWSLVQAELLAEKLIVAINSDDSVRRLKGEDRPVQSEFDRACIVGSIGFVDAVTIFDGDTPLELVKAIRPDVLVKGQEWEGKPVAGSEYAGTVVFAGRFDDRSTTGTIDSIARR